MQAVYAYAGSNRASKIVPLIRRWAADVETTVRVTAKESNAVRHVRWVHTNSCVLSVMVVKVSKQAVGNFNRLISDLAHKGLKRYDRRYLTWMDTNAYCGIGTMMPYDQPGKTNPNNGFPYGPSAWSRVDQGCWGLRSSRNESVEAHEMFHNLGAVQYSAPNSTKAGHCNDEWDVMCYPDGGPRDTMHVRCSAKSHNALLDCGRNDYFDPRSNPSTYLRTHWNTARSSFLDSGSGAPPTLYDLSASVPSDGLGDVTADVSLTLSVVYDSPLDHVELAAARDGSHTFAPIDATGGTITSPVVTLDRGHIWTISASVVDTKGRPSVTLTTTFDLPRDLPPTVTKPVASLDFSDADVAYVFVDWQSDDDGYVAQEDIYVRTDGAPKVLLSENAWPGDEVEVATGHAYRFIIKVTDDADQVTWSDASDELVIAANP